MNKIRSVLLWVVLFALIIGVMRYSVVLFPSLGEIMKQTGIYLLLTQPAPPGMLFPLGVGQGMMIAACLLLLYLGIAKRFEPLLLVPIAIGGILANIPGAEMTAPTGLLGVLYAFGIQTGLFPLLIFLGVGAMVDFGPMIANPKISLLGGAAQLAIFGTFLGALALKGWIPFFDLSIKQAAAIAIIGGADGPTSIFLGGKLAPELLGAIAVAAYSYMALVPIIQPPIMRALTNQNERKIRMKQLRPVSRKEKILFPLVVMLLTGLLMPMSMPLIGMLMFGNLLKESGVTERLSKMATNELINIVTVLLGLAVGSKLSAALFLVPETLAVLTLGAIAFGIGTAAGVLMAKLMNLFLKDKINPLVGSAGVSAMPMAARVSEKLGQEADPHNHLVMHAMGANVSSSLCTAIVAGVLLALCS